MATRKRKQKLSPIPKQEFEDFNLLAQAFCKKNLIPLVGDLKKWDEDGVLPKDAGFRVFVSTVETTLQIDVQTAMKVARGYIQTAAFDYILRVAEAQSMMNSITAMPKEGKTT